MIGKTTGSRPSRALSSVWQTPTASTRTRISSSRGSSRSNSSIDSAAPASQATAAWIFTRFLSLAAPSRHSAASREDRHPAAPVRGSGGGNDPRPFGKLMILIFGLVTRPR
jgi:hypothetical protein